MFHVKQINIKFIGFQEDKLCYIKHFMVKVKLQKHVKQPNILEQNINNINKEKDYE